jgi:hypothetical protein
MIFIRGDISDGSDNDQLLQTIIGPNWKVLSGADQPIHSPGASPGYNHSEYWPDILQRAEERKKKNESPCEGGPSLTEPEPPPLPSPSQGTDAAPVAVAERGDGVASLEEDNK